MDQLISLFEGELSADQISAIYLLTEKNYEKSFDCLIEGPTIQSMLRSMNVQFRSMPTVKIKVDQESVWADMIAFYKGKGCMQANVRIQINNQPVIDTGGVRRQVYTQVYTDFANNEHVKLFDGPANYLRPACTAEARSSGLLKVLGSMIAHSIYQDGIGFPFLSPTCYWYLIGGENMALEFATLQDVPADTALLITKVSHIHICVAIDM